MESSEIKIRGHHLYNLFYGLLPKDREAAINYQFHILALNKKRYGKHFSRNMKDIILDLSYSPEKRIKLLAGKEDDICRPCLKICRREVGSGYKYDKNIIEALGCEVNGIYTVDDIMEKGKYLIEFYKRSLPLKKGRPKQTIIFGKMLAKYQSGR